MFSCYDWRGLALFAQVLIQTLTELGLWLVYKIDKLVRATGSTAGAMLILLSWHVGSLGWIESNEAA